jgi:hypothetical protein
MGFLDKYIRFRKRMMPFRRPVEVILYIIVAAISMNVILKMPQAFLDVYEAFGLTPSPGVVYMSALLQYGWPVCLLAEIGLFAYFVLYRKQSWPGLLVFWLTFAIIMYYEVSLVAFRR